MVGRMHRVLREGQGLRGADYAAAAERGCTVHPSEATKFDLSLAGAILSGNLVLLGGSTGMHLTRAP
jgi:hypothetical protein